ncbi:hypothetical protein LK12_17535 [Novosphingobium malaysiense]|uniref:TonB-dependent receptor n=2 Tax=Novosphingobium malaysiense TaxID=1348853 RepID=A0A0B1ZH07_9SPHN|nr:hypothetical protein LK12_17535 [Novosphingobium malaysiense]
MMVSLRQRRAALLGCSTLAFLAFDGTALAQDAGSQPQGIQEIIVTAQKRQQSVQDIPVAVTALTSEALTTNRITSVLDLSAQAPNLTIRPAAGGIDVPSYTMRGSVTYGSVSGQDKTIAVYLDGVYMGGAYGSAFDLPDLARVEVLRGPQGTLFGRNSTAGAISIVTRDPSGELGGRQQITFGNYDQMRTSTRVELPQIGPFSASISYTHSERHGDVKNLSPLVHWDYSAAAPGSLIHEINTNTVKRFGDRNSDSVFAALKFEPGNGDFKAVYKFDWNQNHFTPEANQLVGYDPAVLNYLSPGFGDLISTLQLFDPPVEAGQSGPSTAKNILTVPGLSRNWGHNLTMTYQINDRLSVKNVFGYRKSELIAVSSIGGYDTIVPDLFGPLAGSVFTNDTSISESHARQWSDEIQFNYTSNLLTLTAGGIYFDIRTSNGSPENLVSYGALFTNFLFGGVIPSGQQNVSYYHGKSYAAYVQAEIHATPQLDIVGGARITRDEKSNTSYNWSTTSNAQFVYPSTYKDTRPSFSLGVNYSPTQELLLYGKYSTGYVSGGSVSGFSYQPETAKSWEAGIKSEWFGRRLQANLALFDVTYKNLQAVAGGANLPTPNYDVGTLILREGDLTAKGFELELTALPVEGLTLRGATGYTDSTIKNINPLVRTTYETTLRPDWTVNLSAQYDTPPVFGNSYLMFHVDGNYRSKITNLQGTPSAAGGNAVKYSDAVWMLNGRIALRDLDIGGANGEIALWGRNLTNERVPAFPVDFRVGIVTSTYTPARTYGVDLTIDF